MKTDPFRAILTKYASQIKCEKILSIHEERVRALERDFWIPALKSIDALPDEQAIEARSGRPICRELDQAEISLGALDQLMSEEQQLLQKAIEQLFPWRKGPFRLFGKEIDAEWRSNLKWDRIEPHLGPLHGKRILDIGCGNAYYLMRLLGFAARNGEQPECVLGVDPSERFYLAYRLFEKLAPLPLAVGLLGVEHSPLFNQLFDLVLCLGIIYHQREPIKMLDEVRSAMKPGARLILESQTIPGDSLDPLVVTDRYAKAKNVYFIPTTNCLLRWVKEAGFREAHIVSHVRLAEHEQRRTELAPYESLSDFLNPTDRTKTVEGLPAPYRSVLVCKSPGTVDSHFERCPG